MATREVIVTREGLAKMKSEVKERIDVKRPEIAERLNIAIKMGDLKENADYHVAKEDSGFNEGRIRMLQDAIMDARVIEEGGPSDTIRVGSTAMIAEEGYEDEPEAYRIVGAHEADPLVGMISNESPIGRALLGAKVGQTVSAETPAGKISFKVLEIK